MIFLRMFRQQSGGFFGTIFTQDIQIYKVIFNEFFFSWTFRTIAGDFLLVLYLRKIEYSKENFFKYIQSC